MRAASLFANTTVVLLIENNFGGSIMASRIADVVKQYEPVRVLSGDSTKHRRVGVVTTDVVKERARVDVQRLLRTDTLRFLFDEEFITGPTVGDTPILQQIRDQLVLSSLSSTSTPSAQTASRKQS